MLHHIIGGDANMTVAKALRFEIQNMSEVYPDTDDIPDSEWSEMVAVAFEHTNG